MQCLAQPGKIKPIMSLGTGQQLPAKQAFYSPTGRDFFEFRFFCTGDEGFDRIGVLFGQDGASGIQEQATRLQAGPERFQQCQLNLTKSTDMFRAAQEFDIGMSTNDACRRARRVQKNAIKRVPIPPLRRLSGIPANNVCCQLKSLQILMNSLKSPCIIVQSNQAFEGESAFKQMAGFTPRGRACIEDLEAWLQFQEPGYQLRSLILHAEKPLIEPGKSTD